MKNKKALKKKIKELTKENDTIKKINRILVNQIEKAGTDNVSVISDS